jgi:hypothetical protein
MVVSNVRAFSKRASACNTPDCFKQALEALGKVSAKDPKGQPILRSKLESLVNTGLNLVNHKKALGRALDGLGRQLQGLSPLVARTKDQDDVAASLSWHRLAGKAITPENVSPFGELVANLLVRKGLLRETGGANGLVRSLADGKAIDAIALDGHSLKVRLADANSEPREREVAVSLTELAVPPVGLTLNDWVLLARGRIQLDAEVTTLADLAKRAQAIELGPIPDSEMEFWSKVSARFMSFDEAIRRLDAIAGKVADSAEHQLARWLFSGAWGELVKRPPLPDGPGVAVSLPGLATLTSETTIALRDWKPRTGDIKTIARETRLEAQAGTQVGMSQETWFFTYVTPTVGYATTRSDFGIPLTGIQIYPFPNPIDVPMWTGKDDWRRIFSLELGLSPRVNAFGPDDRYSGPGGLPPLYAGIGVQLLPYTVVSVGGLLAERRNSTLPEERAEVFVTGYFAGSVQINVPDLIAALNTRKSQAEK